MNFAEVLTKDFLLNHQGRINRQRYWAFFLVSLGASVLAMIIDSMLTGGLLYILVAVVLIYPSFIVAIKRWHDRDKSGWWCLIALVPVIGGLWFLIECGFLQGSSGPNRFGADPLAPPPPSASKLLAFRPKVRGMLLYSEVVAPPAPTILTV